MNGLDPIASSTLAHLYLTQGHRRKARRILAAVLERNPLDGHALHLRARLDATDTGEIALRQEDDHLRVGWKGARSPQGASVVLHALWVDEDGLHRWVSSTAILEAHGETTFSVPYVRGHATACMGRVVAGRGFVPEAVSDPLVWTPKDA